MSNINWTQINLKNNINTHKYNIKTSPYFFPEVIISYFKFAAVVEGNTTEPTIYLKAF